MTATQAKELLSSVFWVAWRSQSSFLTAEGQHKFSECQLNYARLCELRNAFYGEIYATLSACMSDFLRKGKVRNCLGLP